MRIHELGICAEERPATVGQQQAADDIMKAMQVTSDADQSHRNGREQ